MKYIDVERLEAEIKGLQCEQGFEDGMEERGYQFAIKDILDIIDSLQQEQQDDVCSVIEEYYGKEPPVEDKRKAAYHFFSAGRAFELKKIEEERVKHITDLLDNYQKGKEAGYKEAISELKEGKIECSPVMKELIDKLFGIGNTFNFGFGPKDFPKEQPEIDLDKETIIDYVHNHYHYDKDFDGYGHSDLRPVFTREDLVKLARHFFNLGKLNVRKEENK